MSKRLVIVGGVAAGHRSYLARRMLMNRGRAEVYNVLGSYDLIRQVAAARKPATPAR